MKAVTQGRLIVGRNCPNCKIVENWMEENKIICPTLFAEDNMQICRSYDIRSVPAFILDEGTVLRDVQSIIDYFKGL